MRPLRSHIQASALLTLLVFTGCEQGNRQNAAPGDRAPEGVYRQFMMASLAGEEEMIRPLIVDHPDADVLWQGPYPPPVAAALGEQYQTMEIVREGADDPQRVLLQSSAVPVPLAIVNVDGVWKVDPAPLIELRKAAEKFK